MRRSAVVRRYLKDFDTNRLPQIFTDVAVLGSGVAGLRAAIGLAESCRVSVLTKDEVAESNSFYAQGGIAAVITDEDSVENHVEDTLATGRGLSKESVVRRVVREAPEVVDELIAMGAHFDTADGHISVSREGGHSNPRVLHARGDETGKEITSTLIRAVRASPGIDLYERTFVIDLLTEEGGDAVIGLLAWNQSQGLFVVRAARTILASGGAGRIYRETTNPEVTTGDGLAMAYRAGANVADMEFVQFHPTTLYIAGASRYLISETVRGEGGRLVDKAGDPFMDAYHPQGDLAPRDVVSRAILDHMRKTGATHVYLDLSEIGPDVRARFPGIAEACGQFDIDIAEDRIPVRPSAHYMIGGVRVDTHGRTSLPGLYACGEVASTGLHGANRLGSNSLLEGLVYGRAAAQHILEELPADGGDRQRVVSEIQRSTRGRLNLRDVRNSLLAVMWRNVGIIRNEFDLREADGLVAFWQSYVLDKIFDEPSGWELQNMLTIGRLVGHGALLRTESRGVHFRSDYPDRDDENWQKHIVFAYGHNPSIE